MKSLISMQKLFKNNNIKKYSDIDLGLVLVNAFEKDFGKIIMANAVVLKCLGYTSGEVKHARISAIQPTLVKQAHE